MNRLTPKMRLALTALTRYPISLVLTALVTLALAAPLAAQEPPKDMVAFKASVTGPVLPGFVIPVDPPMVAVIGRSTGQLPLLGQTPYIEKQDPMVPKQHRLLFLQPRPHVDPIDLQVDHLLIRQPPLPPGVVLLRKARW
jgi:hypothetical protein